MKFGPPVRVSIAKRASDVMTPDKTQTNKLEWWMILKIFEDFFKGVSETLVRRKLDLKAKLACSSLQNLKVINISRTLLLLVLTLAFVFVSRGFSEKSDYLTWKWHPNKIITRFLLS